MPPENRWIAGTRITAIGWATEPRVRVLSTEEELVLEQLNRCKIKLLGFALMWWFLCCVFWFGLSYLWEYGSLELLWHVCKYGSMLVGALAAIFGACFFVWFVLSRGRFFQDDRMDFYQ